MAGFRHSCGALQCDVVRSSAGWEHRWDILHWQRGSVWHLLPDSEADDAHLWWPEPPRLSHHVRRHHMPSIPWPGLTRSLSLLMFVCMIECASMCWSQRTFKQSRCIRKFVIFPRLHCVILPCVCWLPKKRAAYESECGWLRVARRCSCELFLATTSNLSWCQSVNVDQLWYWWGWRLPFSPHATD